MGMANAFSLAASEVRECRELRDAIHTSSNHEE
jgi:hypothetical protein